MEENKEDIIYDLEVPASHAEGAEEQSPRNSDNSEGSDNSEESDEGSDAELAPDSALTDAPDGAAVETTALHNPHEAELKRMVEEMGAETLLEIIRDNRNAAIRQIISEVEASRDSTLPSGASAAPSCSSIFDLAALA